MKISYYFLRIKVKFISLIYIQEIKGYIKIASNATPKGVCEIYFV